MREPKRAREYESFIEIEFVLVWKREKERKRERRIVRERMRERKNIRNRAERISSK